MKTYKKYKNKLLKIKEPGTYLKYLYEKLWVNGKEKKEKEREYVV